MRNEDGSAGDADYGVISTVYAGYRREEPRIAAVIARSLGDARTVLNVGAGAGSYEPRDRDVVAVEPSASMRALRPRDLPPAIDATAEELPFADGEFEAAMTTFSVHQWPDLRRGLSEMRRVSRGPVVVLTCDPRRVREFWLYAYAPEVLDVEAGRYPEIAAIEEALGGRTAVESVPIPANCVDGFTEAYFARPERLLEHDARLANSAWGFVDDTSQRRFVENLENDLSSGAWDERYASYRTSEEFLGSLVLVTSQPLD